MNTILDPIVDRNSAIGSASVLTYPHHSNLVVTSLPSSAWWTMDGALQRTMGTSSSESSRESSTYNGIDSRTTGASFASLATQTHIYGSQIRLASRCMRQIGVPDHCYSVRVWVTFEWCVRDVCVSDVWVMCAWCASDVWVMCEWWVSDVGVM
jgi:hypothetical protein